MEKLFLSLEGNYFIIETESTSFYNLRISNEKGNKYFETLSEKKWQIEAEKVAQLLNPGQEDRVSIYYGENNLEINVEAFEVIVGESLMFQILDTYLFLYISLDSKLRFIWNQPPSARVFLKEWFINSIETVGTSNIKINLTLISSYFPIDKNFFVIKNRKEKNKFEIEATNICSKKIKQNTYENKIFVEFNGENVLKNIHPKMVYDTFDTTIVDFFIRIEPSQLFVTNYNFRIPFPTTNRLTDSWVRYEDDMMVLFNWYPTLHGMFSSKIGSLKNEEYRFYLEKIQQSKEPKKNVILITEYPHKAQDNGMFFFKYLMSNQNKYEPYFIITKDSPDLDNLKSYMDNVVIFKSKKHIDLLFKASYIAHTHTSNYALPFISSETEKQKIRMKKIFLQHGIIALKNVDFVYSKISNPYLTNKFLVSSEREKQQVMKQLSYPEDEISVTGLARFDFLLEGNSFFKTFSLRKKVLLMPTWRSGQDLLSDEEFVETDFYKYYSDLINDKELNKILRDKKVEINLYLHNNFQKYNHLFASKSVNIISADQMNVQSLLKNHGILITDYSSVGLDFALQKRTVIYYQFDKDKEEISEGATERIDLLPGPVFEKKEPMIEFLKSKIKNNILEKKYRNTLKKNIFPFDDRKSCDRIYEVLEEL